jgi:HSP20 family molecular chaperone IbpA
MTENESTERQHGSQDATSMSAAEPRIKARADVEAMRRADVLEPWSWFSDWLEEWPRMFGRRFPMMPMWAPTGADLMRVEQYMDGGELVLRAEVPGVDPDHGIDLSVRNDRLTISAHREQREEAKTDQGFRSEFHYGAVRRVVSLPEGTTAEDVKANYDNGILEVRIPIGAAEQATTKVPIGRKS